MLARCPACQTVFRVSPEQLAARAGRVRCGHCLNAFDALRNGVEGTPAIAMAASPSSAPHAADETQIPTSPDTDAASATEPGSAKEVGEEAQEEGPLRPMPAVFHARSELSEALSPSHEDEKDSAKHEAPPSEDRPPVALPGHGGPPSAAAILSHAAEEEAAGENPAAIAPAPAGQTSATPTDGRGAWGIALGILTMTLLVQGLFLLRQPLTQAMPALREPLAALCRPLGCELPLPRNAAEISIEASDLHPEPGGQGNFVLHATLKNRAVYPQAYPYVELSLTDAADRALVRRVFSPAEWAPDRSPEAPFGPGTSAALAIAFNAAGVAAVGYRVYAFYP